MSQSVEQIEAPEAFALCPPEASAGPRRAKPANGRGRRYKQGPARAQLTLLPPSVEDYVSADNPVRAISAYVDSLDLAALGFSYADGALSAGQPAYDPADLLKLYLYGYLNRVRSSRRLEAECTRNLEVMWLLTGLTPSYHTIADFRKDNAKALRETNRDFVLLCRELGLIGGRKLGIDGSFFNANASDASVKTKAQLEAELAAIERAIAEYHAGLDGQDAAEGEAAQARLTPAQLEALKARVEQRNAPLQQLEATGETQHGRTDPDARRLRKNGQKVTGYNVQGVVDGAHKLICSHEVTNARNDRGQLVPMIEQAEALLTAEEAASMPCTSAPTPEAAEEPREVFADAGYYTEADIAACEGRALTLYVPIPEQPGHGAARDDRLPLSAFHYDAERDGYHCPGGQCLHPVGKPATRNGTIRQRYRSKAKACADCALRAHCLSAKGTRREIERSVHAEAVERHRAHMESARAQGKMRERAALCEHPFGTLKRWLGWDHFLVRGFEKVRGEMALLVQCYNFRRVLSILGVEAFIAICHQRRQARDGGSQEEAAAPLFAPIAALAARLRARLGARKPACVPARFRAPALTMRLSAARAP